MTLKTLKDFSKLRLYRSKSCQLLSRQLKAEAIKWIKALKKAYKLSDGWDCEVDGYKMFPVPAECAEPIEIAGWIKHFFNISESDLK